MTLETLKIIGLLALFPGFIIWAPILMYYSVKKDTERETKEADILEAERMVQIEEEKKNPMYRVKFYVGGGEPHYSVDCPVQYDKIRSKRWFWMHSSKTEAEIQMRHFYKIGYFRNKEDVTFPTCNVTQAFIEVSNDNGNS